MQTTDIEPKKSVATATLTSPIPTPTQQPRTTTPAAPARPSSPALVIDPEDPARDGLLHTPARVAKSLAFLTSGYGEDPRRTVNGAIFDDDSEQMVMVRGIEFYSLCEHHLLPFFGKCHIAYLPAGKIIGLSKLARLVEIFSRRLQVQQRMTVEVAKTFSKLIPNHGVGFVVEAQHLCMKTRGVQKQSGDTITSALLGKFRDDHRTRLEFLTLIQSRHK